MAAVPSIETVLQLRRLINEVDESVYPDSSLLATLLLLPLRDRSGREPDHEDWEGRWDVYAAAAQIWDEKAARVVGTYDFSSDGASFQRSQIVQQYREQARYMRARGSAQSVPVSTWPLREDDGVIGNLSEVDTGVEPT